MSPMAEPRRAAPRLGAMIAVGVGIGAAVGIATANLAVALGFGVAGAAVTFAMITVARHRRSGR